MALLGDLAGTWWHWVSIAAFLLFALVETLRPDGRDRPRLLSRWLGHMGVYVADIVLSSVALPAFVFALVTDRMHPKALRLFAPVESWGGGPAVLLAGMLCLDLMVYCAHRIQHRFAVLWRFHAVHHSDTEMDVSTALLHHPLAYLGVAAFTGFTLLSLGMPAWVFPVYALFEVAGGAFQHVATPVPEWFERLVRPVFVTPGMHQAHHSSNPAHHDTNFGNVLSVWDRLFGTFLALSPAERARIRFGIGEPVPANPLALMAMPFRPAARPVTPPDQPAASAEARLPEPVQQA